MKITASSGGIAGRVRATAGSCESLIWIGVFAVVLLVQWPMVKGFYYRAVPRAAPPPAVEWRTNLGVALAEAGRTNKKVLVDFTADWCPPCIVMKHDVWPNPAVGRAIAASYVPLLIDVDRDGDVADLYNVRGIPTVLVLDKEGRVVREASFLAARSAGAMVEFLTKTE